FNNKTFTITPRAPAVSVVAPGSSYNGAPYAASALATGVGGARVAGTFAYTYYAGSSATGTPLAGPPSALGTYTLVAASPRGDSNYTGGSDHATCAITPAPPPPPPPRPITGALIRKHSHATTRLFLHIAYADTGAMIWEVTSPFQAPACHGMHVLAQDTN